MAGKYEKGFNGIAIRINESCEKYIMKYSITLLNNLVLKTPVDTGRARGSWTVTVNAADENVAKLVDMSGSRAIGNGTKRIMNNYKSINDAIYIQSNLPYIERLDKGWSQQAPYGIVDSATKQTDAQFAFGGF